MNLSQGTKRFDRIVRLGQRFLPKKLMSFSRFDVNSISYCLEVASYLDGSDKTAESFNYFWDGSVDIKISNAKVHFHKTSNDPGLVKFEEKLNVICSHIEEFIACIRDKEQDKEIIEKRTWLNDDKTTNLTTGYICYRINYCDNSGQLYMADCHRTINFWFGDWGDEEDSVSFKKQIKSLEKLKAEINRVSREIVLLREKFQAVTGQ